MKELVVISGKGGTGKTSVSACFAVLAEKAVIADCDVDAADMHLLLEPEVRLDEPFVSGNEARIRPDDCAGCGMCMDLCRFGAIDLVDGTYTVDGLSCEGCGVCFDNCPHDAIDFPERTVGKWMTSDTRAGLMVHARLIPGAENSGKLVAKVRSEAKALAKESGAELVIVDGPPGTGCPVIASVTGADMVLAVTEPTVSGAHDLERVLGLARHFGVSALVCVNKWDLNPPFTEKIEAHCETLGAKPVGRIGFGDAFTEAQLAARTIVEHTDEGPAAEVRALWNRVLEELF